MHSRQLRQRIYELRGRFALRGERAVESFFDLFGEQQRTTEMRSQYVNWAVPRGTATCDKYGRRTAIDRPQIIPFMWKFCPDADDEPVCEAAVTISVMILNLSFEGP